MSLMEICWLCFKREVPPPESDPLGLCPDCKEMLIEEDRAAARAEQ